jgi:hypothetical protein
MALWTGFPNSELGQVLGSHELWKDVHKGALGSLNGQEFLGQLRHYQFLKKDFLLHEISYLMISLLLKLS